MATAKLAPAQHVESLAQQAGMQLRSGNAQKAVELFQQACKLQPRNARLLNDLGYCQQMAGEPAEALKAYQKALKRAPTDILTLCNLGLLQKKLGQLDQALSTFERAIAYAPRDINLICNRANVLLAQGKSELALAGYDQALSLEADNPTVLNGRATVLKDLGRLTAAREDIDRAVQIKADYAQAWSNRGDIYRDLDQHEPAAESYQRALDLSPADPKTLANFAGLAVTHPDQADLAIERGIASLQATIAVEYEPAGPGVQRIRSNGVSLFRLRHDLGQAHYLSQTGVAVDGLQSFIGTAEDLLSQEKTQATHLPVSNTQFQALLPFWRSTYQTTVRAPQHCLNPENNWQELQEQYLDSKPELVCIDNFLSESAIATLRHYCLASRVWIREYPNQYLGAFANQGFNSPLHMQIARELRSAMPLVFKDYGLNQLWGFKYDTRLGKGINIHADFALVNLNFWITPDQYHLNKDRGGLKVYDKPAPADWTFHDYNTDGKTMYAYLAEHQSGHKIIAHRFNRAVLFNSALFHETDEIAFEDSYEGRRINITYLFGRQLG